jgi:hypothetical protein
MIEKDASGIKAADANMKIAEVWKQPKQVPFAPSDLLSTDDVQNTW